jgi:hypothetical protein
VAERIADERARVCGDLVGCNVFAGGKVERRSVHVEFVGVPGRVVSKHHEMLCEADIVFLLVAGKSGIDVLVDGHARGPARD